MTKHPDKHLRKVYSELQSQGTVIKVESHGHKGLRQLFTSSQEVEVDGQHSAYFLISI